MWIANALKPERGLAPANGSSLPILKSTLPSKSLAALAQPVHKSVLLLSAFKQSVGEPPIYNNRRARQDPAGESCRLGDGDRVEAGLQRDQLVHDSFSQSSWDYLDRLFPKTDGAGSYNRE